MPNLMRPGATIYYEVLGDKGPWVTLVNGHTRTLKDFKVMARYLVGRGARVLTFDNRGSGETTYDQPFKITDLADDVVALWDELGVATSDLLGISMGGWISQIVAAHYPDRVRKLVLVSTTGRAKWLNMAEENPWGDDLTAVRSKMAEYFSKDFAVKNKLLIDAMAKQIFQQIDSGSFKENALVQRQGMAGFESIGLLPSIQAPTLILHGKEDAIIPPEAARELSAGIAGSELQLIDGVGHLLLAEYAKPFYETVGNFFLAD